MVPPSELALYRRLPTPEGLSRLRLIRVEPRRALALRAAMYSAVLGAAMVLFSLSLEQWAWARGGAVLSLLGLVLAWWLFARQLAAYAEQARKVEAELRQHRGKLELQVREGTQELLMLAQELSLSNDELRREMDARAKVETELRQAQKLESVGRLAAGVAHEINTPVQFVSDSCHFLRDGMEDLSALIAAYRQAVASLPQSAQQQLQAVEQERDLSYLLEKLPAAIVRCLDGLGRVATIVRSMKAFAHPDGGQKAHADLNQAIRDTLVIAHNEYKYVADVETDFGPLPPVHCYISELNQAVLNLLVNAAHAIAERVGDSGERGQIQVRTRVEAEEVVIEVADTGSGIPEAIRDKIFDPFFTTKEVGRGTGQGLGVVRSVIVDKHRGTVEVESEVGQGSRFILRIPIEAQAQPPAATAEAA